ncbi:MAG TPA: hypothetical protein VFP84_23480 [Kofleriaceae bacterium]|nr:hypothetical protein [Kofleriaceae bacterium]
MLPAHRLHAALTAIAFVVSCVIGMVHEARTRHVRCAEHGELVHVASPSGPARADSPRHASVRATGGLATLVEHEHCTLLPATRDARPAVRGPALVAHRVAVADLPRATCDLPGLPQPRLYRTAPKTSPPA